MNTAGTADRMTAMTWITFLWPTVTGACITIGLIHFGIGLNREQRAPLKTHPKPPGKNLTGDSR